MPNHLPTILSWAAAEGWNPGLEDAAAFLTSDPGGFFTHEAEDQPVAAISVVNHSDTFAFLGLYLCLPEYRGQGIGLALWNRAIRHAGSRTIGLDGVPDQQANYRKSGFIAAGKTVRWQGVLHGAGRSSARAITPQDLPQILSLDRQQTGFERSKFQCSWFSKTNTRRTLVMVRDGKITAYGTIRKCVEGYKIGPFTAHSEGEATELLSGLAQAISADPISIMVDIPAHAPALSGMLAVRGFTPGFETARMYKGAAPTEKLARFSAVATLELG